MNEFEQLPPIASPKPTATWRYYVAGCLQVVLMILCVIYVTSGLGTIYKIITEPSTRAVNLLVLSALGFASHSAWYWARRCRSFWRQRFAQKQPAINALDEFELPKQPATNTPNEDEFELPKQPAPKTGLWFGVLLLGIGAIIFGLLSVMFIGFLFIPSERSNNTGWLLFLIALSLLCGAIAVGLAKKMLKIYGIINAQQASSYTRNIRF